MLIKICGLTREEEVRWAVEAGCDAVGFVLYPPSRRAVTVERARALAQGVPPGVWKVGVAVDLSPEEVLRAADAVPLDAVQWHGLCPGELLREVRRRRPHLRHIVAVPVGEEGLSRSCPAAGRLLGLVDYFLLDTAGSGSFGGSGQVWNWELARGMALPAPFLVAGGLTSRNVTEALERLRPAGVDVSSGVERAGRKDPEKIREFVAVVRGWENRSLSRPRSLTSGVAESGDGPGSAQKSLEHLAAGAAGERIDEFDHLR